MTRKIKFTNTSKSTFYSTLRKRIDTYFREENMDTHANKAMWIKVVFFLSGLTALYLSLLLGNFPLVVMIPLCVLLGMFSAFVGFNICHDAIHNSLSANKAVNKRFAFIFNLIGASPYVWNICHNIVHHTYTNIAGHDEDIDVAPGLIRFSDDEPVNRLQQYQHYYAFMLYSFAMLSWVFRKDYKKFFQKKVGEHVMIHPRIEYFKLFFYKAIYYLLFIALPLMVMDIRWYEFIAGFLIMQFSQGLVLGLVFQLAHVVESTSFPHPDKQGNIIEEWAVHQLLTTANFAGDSKTLAFLCGGLNRQIEHHLFPKICHIHYPAIGKIVKQTATDFNLPYNEYPTFLTALKSHYQMLKKLGKYAYQKKIVLRDKEKLPVITKKIIIIGQ
ncbi:fatty acid desaturase [Pedobacter sp. BAL39]|uniref:fatty acid desaturase family protein n=1 Tax=Pedobacter sp. BAL39 TaxID=391596 RepID=UPI000155AE6C|nr:acyl-CoA desaturase [Pedobacter sp. BAL39]EDM34341.1 fatty acid desaturase [Pedobacter sp. BAL39]